MVGETKGGVNEHCHCLALRKAGRRATQLYDKALEPVGVSATQFSIL
jgi:hypothetical protein